MTQVQLVSSEELAAMKLIIVCTVFFLEWMAYGFTLPLVHESRYPAVNGTYFGPTIFISF